MRHRRRLPKYVSEFRDRHGKARVFFRKKGHATHYFKSVPWTEPFMREYAACLEGEASPRAEPGAERTKAGSISALVVAYYGSAGFQGLTPATKATYRGIVERFRRDHGDKLVAKLERQHVVAIVGARSKTPAAGNNYLRMIRMLMRFAVEIGMRRDDPTLYVRGFRTKTAGFHTWTEEEIAQFEARHSVGSKARLAFALMLHTAQRRSDAVRMGWQHIKDGRISVRQQKTGTALEIPIHPDLKAILDQTPRDNLTFLVTAHGKPFAVAGFGNWFRERCDEAGLPQCSAHGLRKAAARRLAEAGCSERQIMAVTGHKTPKEVTRYTREADQRQLADDAVRRMATKSERNLSNPTERLDKNGTN